MFSSPTTYRSGSRTVEVLPGESHSAAWTYIARGGPAPVSYPCADDRPTVGRRACTTRAAGSRIRRRALTLAA